MVNYHLIQPPQGREQAILHWTRIACVDTLHLIPQTDNHYEQVVQNLEISLAVTRKIMPLAAADMNVLVAMLKTKDFTLLDPKYQIHDDTLSPVIIHFLF